MERRTAFDRVCALYDRYRPRYCEALFSDVFHAAGVTADSQVLEIGCGTGQATKPLLQTGCTVTAVEAGAEMAAYVKRKLANEPRLHIIQSTFEDAEVPESAYDLVLAASSFHWIEPPIALQKAYRSLKAGGVLALLWNRPSVTDPSDPVHQAVHAVYYRHGRNARRGGLSRHAHYLPLMQAHGFVNVRVKCYHAKRQLSADDYVGLLCTYSDHILMDGREDFMEEIREAIDENGGQITVYDTMELYIGERDSLAQRA